MSAARKYLEVLLFVALWMVFGWTFHLSVNAYLLLGVPLLAFFQLGIRREPLRKLWVRDAASFQLDWLGLLLAALLMVVPGRDLFLTALPQRMWLVALWLFCALAGALFAGFALRRQRADAARRGLPGFLAALLIGVAVMAAMALLNGHSAAFPPFKLLSLMPQFLSYFAVSFVLEEVVFRGALDSHLYQTGTDQPSSDSLWLSAIFVSVLWGLWHLPTFSITTAAALAVLIPYLIAVHTLIGVPLSFAWRGGGTLLLPAAAHALIDTYRNIIQ